MIPHKKKPNVNSIYGCVLLCKSRQLQLQRQFNFAPVRRNRPIRQFLLNEVSANVLPVGTTAACWNKKIKSNVTPFKAGKHNFPLKLRTLPWHWWWPKVIKGRAYEYWPCSKPINNGWKITNLVWVEGVNPCGWRGDGGGSNRKFFFFDK